LKEWDLLRQAEGQFDAFVPADQYIRDQQNLAQRGRPILELSTNDWRRIRAAADLIRSASTNLQPGE